MPVLDEHTSLLQSQVREAHCQIDLLQLIGFVTAGEDGGLPARLTLELRLTFREPGEVIMFAGAEQAAIYIRAFEFADELQKQIGISKLAESLTLDLELVMELPEPLVAGHFLMEEGKNYDAKYPYLVVEGSPAAIACITTSVLRICNYQSEKGMAAAGFRVAPAVQVMVSAVRFPTPTLSAYGARGAAIAGSVRSRGWHQTYQPTEAPRSNELRWTVNSRELSEWASDSSRLRACGYDDRVAKEMASSGLYVIPRTDYLAHHLDAFALDGVEPGKFYCSDMEEQTTARRELSNEQFLLIDSFYQRIWDTMGMRPVATYGQTSDLPLSNGFTVEAEAKNGQPLRRTATAPTLLGVCRAEETRIPRFLVSDYQELRDVTNRAKAGLRQTGQSERRLFFRGQRRHYSVTRAARVSEFLYGKKEDEVSLLTAAAREKFDYDRFAPAFQLQMQAMLYERAGVAAFRALKPDWVSRPIGKCPFADPGLERAYATWLNAYKSFRWEQVVMALAQHYGVPTHGLDLTEDVDIAVWFALRGRGDEDPGQPVVYLIASDNPDLQSQLDWIDELGLGALRPARQRAVLHFGGWGLHSNICAQEVVAIAELGPEFTAATPMTEEYFFPGPDDDLFLRDLMALKDRALRAGVTYGYSYVE